jgi:hypothetical protein
MSASWFKFPATHHLDIRLIDGESVGGPTLTSDFDGDSLDMYDVGEVISPYSNCASHKWNGTAYAATTIGIEVLSMDPSSQAYTLNIRFSDPLQLSPSKPMNLQATRNTQNAASLTWSANSEPDVTSGGGYNVYRAIYYSGGPTPTFSKINGSLLTTTSFVDNNWSGISIPSGTSSAFQYRVTTTDNTGKE